MSLVNCKPNTVPKIVDPTENVSSLILSEACLGSQKEKAEDDLGN